MNHKFPYKWYLKDAIFTKDKGKVFSCFACGGGSTMGYKLAGYDVIGDNEIDPKMNKVYLQNHHPRLNYLCDIRELVEMAEEHSLPDEMYALDILDASFPCSSFSTAGQREKGWGKEKQFREGQVSQVLDTLCFDSIRLADALRPKVVLFENVKGLIIGKAMNYTNKIIEELDKIGYVCKYYLLNASTMGVPQRRERVFFICLRKDYVQKLFPNGYGLNMNFTEQFIPYGDFADEDGKEFTTGTKIRHLWENRIEGDKLMCEGHIRLYGIRTFYAQSYVYKDKICPTLTSHQDSLIPFHKPKYTSDYEVKCISSFPQDFDFCGQKSHYVCGMSVPPVMMAQVASRIYEQIISRIND